MAGTAYRTPIAPKVYTSADDNAAVYAIYPPAAFDSGFRSTTHVIVSASDPVGDTVVHPCDKAGQMLGFDLIAHVTVRNHRVALRAAGYDLEVVIPRVEV